MPRVKSSDGIHPTLRSLRAISVSSSCLRNAAENPLKRFVPARFNIVPQPRADVRLVKDVGACTAGKCDGRVPRKALRGGISKSILQRSYRFLAINAKKMAPRTHQWLQDRTWDAPTKGLAWERLRIGVQGFGNWSTVFRGLSFEGSTLPTRLDVMNPGER